MSSPCLRFAEARVLLEVVLGMGVGGWEMGDGVHIGGQCRFLRSYPVQRPAFCGLGKAQLLLHLSSGDVLSCPFSMALCLMVLGWAPGADTALSAGLALGP